MTECELERYMRLYYKSVYRIALCRCKDPEDANDAAQEVFLKLYTVGGKFNGDEHVKAWLLRCAMNLGTDMLRARINRAAARTDTREPVYYDDKDTDSGRVFELFRELPEKNRTAMYLHYCEGYSVEEVSDITGASRSAVLSRLKRGRDRLKDLLKKEGIGKYGI